MRKFASSIESASAFLLVCAPFAVAVIGAGLVLGVAGRIAMRMIALGAGLPAGFSPAGSLEVVMFGGMLGSPVALALLVASVRLALPVGTGIAASAFLLIGLIAFPPPAAQSALASAPGSAGYAMFAFAGGFLLYGLTLELLVHRHRHRPSGLKGR